MGDNDWKSVHTYVAEEADIPDSIIDQTLCLYKQYFTKESWSLINQISE